MVGVEDVTKLSTEQAEVLNKTLLQLGVEALFGAGLGRPFSLKDFDYNLSLDHGPARPAKELLADRPYGERSHPHRPYCPLTRSRPYIEVTTGPRNNSLHSSQSTDSYSARERESIVASKGKAVDDGPDAVKTVKGGNGVILVPKDLHPDARISLFAPDVVKMSNQVWHQEVDISYASMMHISRWKNWLANCAPELER